MNPSLSVLSTSSEISEARHYPRELRELSHYLHEPDFEALTRQFLFDQLNPHADIKSSDLPVHQYPHIGSKISVFHSAIATFYAPSDDAGIRGMKRERIRATPSWRGKSARNDCALLVEDEALLGMKGMSAVRIKLFFSFEHKGQVYPCTLVEWFQKIGQSSDPVTGMWRVRPEMAQGKRVVTVVHLDTFLRGVHLIPIFGDEFIPVGFSYTDSLDAFEAFYVSKYADHHSHEIIF